MLLDELYERAHSLSGGNSAADAIVTHVKVYLADTAAHVTKVGVCHLTGPVHDAAHDSDADPWQMPCALLDHRSGLLEVEEGTAARGTADEFSFRDAHPRGLQQIEGSFAQLGGVHRVGLPKHALTKAIHEEASKARGGTDDQFVLALAGDDFITQPQHDRHWRGAFDRGQHRKESPRGAGDAAMPLGTEQDQPGTCEAQGLTHHVERLLAIEDHCAAAKPFGQVLAD
mmetsp:Transcript_88113/g.247795  ORF Transcript_88113/g.247795 Transcript_88113/m.247795 type:complete len:228 (-) Transcript_88113:1690-2373(-)